MNVSVICRLVCFVSTERFLSMEASPGHEKAPAKGCRCWCEERAGASYRRAFEARAAAKNRCSIAPRVTTVSTNLVPVSERWDVVVVGAGPAGLSAAYEAARRGARTLVLERAEHPRYKTCGGGLIGPSLAAAAGWIDVPVADRVNRLTFTHDGRHEFRSEERR